MSKGAGRRAAAAVVLLCSAFAVSACTIQVPVAPEDPVGGGRTPAQTPAPGTPTTTDAAAGESSELPPLTRAQIISEDMTFARGAYIEPGEAVSFSDGVSQTPGWDQTKMMVNGESVYVSDKDCTASLRYTNVQDPLVVDGDDKASTESLFRFQNPSILPEYLMTTSWLWGESPGDSTAAIEFLTYMQDATEDSPASAVSMRLFHSTRTGVVFTVSCASNEQLRHAVADIRSRVSVVPPS